MDEAPVKERRSTGGRPTRAEAQRRDERVLDIAGTMFLEQGFEGTAIDAIAAAAGVGKPSLYARYGDKHGLFVAVVRRRLAQWTRPLDGLDPEGRPMTVGEVREGLKAFARRMLHCCVAPEAIALGRILTSEALRFPDLARVLHEQGWMRGIAPLARFLDRAIDFPRSQVRDADLAADLFFGLIVGRLPRQAMLGIPVDPRTFETRIEAAVSIFLGSGFILQG